MAPVSRAWAAAFLLPGAGLAAAAAWCLTTAHQASLVTPPADQPVGGPASLTPAGLAYIFLA